MCIYFLFGSLTRELAFSVQSILSNERVADASTLVCRITTTIIFVSLYFTFVSYRFSIWNRYPFHITRRKKEGKRKTTKWWKTGASRWYHPINSSCFKYCRLAPQTFAIIFIFRLFFVFSLRHQMSNVHSKRRLVWFRIRIVIKQWQTWWSRRNSMRSNFDVRRWSIDQPKIMMKPA